MKIFIVESPNPMDLLQNRSEHQCLEQVCNLIGHEAASFLVKSKNELQTAVKYISSIDSSLDNGKDETSPLCIHLSAHGNNKGLAFGDDFLDWQDVVNTLKPLFNMNDFPYDWVLAISACGTNSDKLRKQFISLLNKSIEEDGTPPKFLFAFNESTISWSDAVLGWTILYHQIARINIDKPAEVRDILKRMKTSYLGNLMYFRWDTTVNKFKTFQLAE